MIENVTERLVSDEIEKLKAVPQKADGPCWCPLCEHDILALSLTALSPRYGTRFTFPSTSGSERLLIGEAVSAALARVSLHPRHERYREETSPVELRLVNFSRVEGNALLESLPTSDESDGTCACTQCRAETLAYALNRYPPRYGLERNGIVEFPREERDAIRAEMSSFISYAASVVAEKPRHPLS